MVLKLWPLDSIENEWPKEKHKALPFPKHRNVEWIDKKVLFSDNQKLERLLMKENQALNSDWIPG